ncbi:LPP20 family lipoprotein [uncultured Lentibacter sp.]|uniref:LPP20 family lipoprotein n=1 Tax=uncultured Lentibacter sp. TaxID=1659309 RepID=UPI002618E1E2|nr:LPP20 family lipoprotein [uncultured Lentibacter sp.]
MSRAISNSLPLKTARALGLGVSLVLVSGCQMGLGQMLTSSKSPQEITSQAQARELSQTKKLLDVTTVKSVPVPTISAVGYSVISSQPGKTLNQKRLMAIRAARMDAMRILTEQIHGLSVQSETQLSENVLQSDTMRASIAGVIRGARTVKIEPKGGDTYSVHLEIDRATIAQVLKAHRGF